MIHQLIFANPKPGMSVQDFQDYWVNVHAVKYAAKIPQIVRYKIDTVINIDNEKPMFNGIGEIWLRNEEEQLESLKSKEFLEGARLDEPNWAAFWETIVLDTTAFELKSINTSNSDMIKLVVLAKRKEGVPIDLFRNYSSNSHSRLVLELPELEGYVQCYTMDAAYRAGEPRFDAVYHMWFPNYISLKQTTESSMFKNTIITDMAKFVEMKYFFTFAYKEHWIIE